MGNLLGMFKPKSFKQALDHKQLGLVVLINEKKKVFIEMVV
jgi:hypothetical protein